MVPFIVDWGLDFDLNQKVREPYTKRSQNLGFSEFLGDEGCPWAETSLQENSDTGRNRFPSWDYDFCTVTTTRIQILFTIYPLNYVNAGGEKKLIKPTTLS